MVRHADAVSLQVLGQLGKVAIAQVASRHLDAHLVQLGILLGVEVDAAQGDAHLLAEVYAELLVAIALLTTQMKIAMGGRDVYAQRIQNA